MERNWGREPDALEQFGRIVRQQRERLDQAAAIRAAHVLKEPTIPFDDCCRVIERLMSPADAEFLALHFHQKRAAGFRRDRAHLYAAALTAAELKWTAALARKIGGAGTARATTLHARFRWTILQLRFAGWLYWGGLAPGRRVDTALGEIRRLLSPPVAAVVTIRPV